MIKIDSKALGMEKEGDELIKNSEALVSPKLEKNIQNKGKIKGKKV